MRAHRDRRAGSIVLKVVFFLVLLVIGGHLLVAALQTVGPGAVRKDTAGNEYSVKQELRDGR